MATYAGRYDEILLRKSGNRLAPAAANTTVQVYESDGSTEATIYTDRTKTTTAVNPVSVDSAGNLEFFADPGDYVLAIREDGVQIATNTVSVFKNPAEDGSVDSVNGRTGAVTLVKGDVGLGNVDNTSDLSKPVSTAQQTALDAKAPLDSPALTGTPTVPTAVAGTNTTQAASTAFVGAAIDNATSGVATPPINTYIGPLGLKSYVAGAAMTDGQLTATKIALPAGTYDSLAINVTAGAASSFIRLGLYTDTAGLPGTLLDETAALDSSTSGAKAGTINVAIATDWYWLGAVGQGGEPSVITVSENPNVHVNSSSLATQGGVVQNAVTGALPTTFAGSTLVPTARCGVVIRAASFG